MKAQSNNIAQKSGADAELRRARNRFNSSKTKAMLKKAILEVSGMTEFDAERIIEQLRKCLRQFKHHPAGTSGRRGFHSEIAACAVKQARLVSRRSVIRELHGEGHIGTMVFLRLPEFAGTDEEFYEWVRTTGNLAQEAFQVFASWSNEHKQTVRNGIWKILKSCQDLGLGKFTDEDERTRHLVVEELEAQVWQQVAYEADKILSTPEPVWKQLYSRGKWAARAWKTATLRRNRTRAGDKYFIGINGLETVIKNTNGGMEEIEVAVESVRDPRANFNPFKLPPDPLWNGENSEREWTNTDMERDLRHAGLFRADGNYNAVEFSFAIAA